MTAEKKDPTASRICLLGGDLASLAGGPIYCSEIARRLSVRGHDVTVICFDSQPELSADCRVIEIGRSPSRVWPVLWRFAYTLDLWHVRRELKRIDVGSFDVILGLEHVILKELVALRPGTPFVYIPLSFIAALEIESYRLTGLRERVAVNLFKSLQRWALEKAAVTIRFTSLSGKELDKYYLGKLEPNYEVVPIAADFPESVNRESPGSPLRLLTVGRLVPSKNISLALNAVAKLGDSDWIFDVVGDGGARPELERLARELGIQDRVHFHGRQPETDSWYRQADLFLFPSKLDNSPLVVVEAMGYGVPCLGMYADGVHYKNANSEIITDGVDGLLANGEGGFEKKLAEIVHNPEMLLPLGRRARETALEKHSWERHIDELERIVGQVAHSRTESSDLDVAY